MKKLIILSVMVFGLIVTATLATPGDTSAYELLGEACKKGGSSSACQGQVEASGGNNPITGNDGLFSRIANIVALVAGAAAVIVIILGGLRFVTANGDASAVKAGRSMIIGAVIGLAVIALARTIVYFVVSKV